MKLNLKELYTNEKHLSPKELSFNRVNLENLKYKKFYKLLNTPDISINGVFRAIQKHMSESGELISVSHFTGYIPQIGGYIYEHKILSDKITTMLYFYLLFLTLEDKDYTYYNVSSLTPNHDELLKHVEIFKEKWSVYTSLK